MKQRTKTIGSLAVISATAGFFASGCGSSQSSLDDFNRDRRYSQLDTAATTDPSGTGYESGGTVGGSDESTLGDTSWNAGDSLESPSLNPVPGSAYPGTGSSGGSGEGGSGVIPEVDSLDPETLPPRTDSLDVPDWNDWNSNGGY